MGSLVNLTICRNQKNYEKIQNLHSKVLLIALAEFSMTDLVLYLEKKKDIKEATLNRFYGKTVEKRLKHNCRILTRCLFQLPLSTKNYPKQILRKILLNKEYISKTWPRKIK